VKLIKTLPVKFLTLFLDNDRRGKELTEEIIMKLESEIPVKVVNWKGTKAKDPGELEEMTIRALVKAAEKKIYWPSF
jgi:5S rRNA maturation endonuclease (ribonuclease M5)